VLFRRYGIAEASMSDGAELSMAPPAIFPNEFALYLLMT
jgi:hypothetical protein